MTSLVFLCMDRTLALACYLVRAARDTTVGKGCAGHGYSPISGTRCGAGLGVGSGVGVGAGCGTGVVVGAVPGRGCGLLDVVVFGFAIVFSVWIVRLNVGSSNTTAFAPVASRRC